MPFSLHILRPPLTASSPPSAFPLPACPPALPTPLAAPIPAPQCAHFAAFHRLPSQPTRVVDQRPSRAYIGQFTPDGDIFIGARWALLVHLCLFAHLGLIGSGEACTELSPVLSSPQ